MGESGLREWSGPKPLRCTGEVRDDEQDLLFILGVGDRAHTEDEETLRDECSIFRDFAAKLGKLC